MYPFNISKTRRSRTRTLGLITLICCWPVGSALAEVAAQQVYQQRCAACHGGDAQGTTGFYPSLIAAAARLTPEQLAFTILRGKFDRAGEQDGQTIPVMPAHDDLSNEEVAALVNHFNAQAKTSHAKLTPDHVAALRQGSAGADTPYLSEERYQVADRLYHERCAGCHSVDRNGRAGTPLPVWRMQQLGTAALKTTIHFGTHWGMPNWGMQETISPEHISWLAQYLQLPSRGLPRFDVAAVRASHAVMDVGGLPREAAAPPRNLFVTLLHDPGRLMLFDGQHDAPFATVDVMLAPHRVIRSADGRYLYVMSRSAEVAMVDLLQQPITVTARIKVGFEGQSLALSAGGATLAVGSYWPPQVALLDAQTLSLRQLHLMDQQAHTAHRTNQEVSQVWPLNKPDEYVAVLRQAGQFAQLLNSGNTVTKLTGVPFLRTGSPSANGQFLIVPSDQDGLSVFDLRGGQTPVQVPAPGLLAAVSGTAYVHDGSSFWVSAGMESDLLVKVRTQGDPEQWQVVDQIQNQGGGSLHVTSHPPFRAPVVGLSAASVPCDEWFGGGDSPGRLCGWCDPSSGQPLGRS